MGEPQTTEGKMCMRPGDGGVRNYALGCDRKEQHCWWRSAMKITDENGSPFRMEKAKANLGALQTPSCFLSFKQGTRVGNLLGKRNLAECFLSKIKD